MSGLFKDRRDAGIRLSGELTEFANNDAIIVLGLPRGGVPVAFEVARILNSPLDLFIVRKLGVPGREELAFGAIATGDVIVLNNDIVKWLDISDDIIKASVEMEKSELKRREFEYRGNKPPLNVKNKIVILIDDGLATGASMKAAVEALKQLYPSKIIVAVPTAAPETCSEFEKIVDKIICATTPSPFRGVGLWYDNFAQVSDEEVKYLLKKAEQFKEQHS